MTDVYSLKDKNDDLVVMAQDLAAIACVYGQGTIPAKLSVNPAGELLPLPTNWFALGELDQKAGAKISPEIKTTDVYGYGSMAPRRTVKTEESVTVSFSAQESRNINLSMFWGKDLSGVTADANGEWQFKKSGQSGLIYYSIILIGQDSNSAGDVFPYWIFPKTTITKTDAIQLQNDSAIIYPFQFQTFEDKAYGGYVGVGSAGAGQAAVNAAAGFASGS